MTFQDEFVQRLRVVGDVATGDGRSPAVACGSTGSGRTETDHDKPLLFRGGDTRGGGDADASLASANGGGAGRDGLKAEGSRFDDRNHPNPSFEKEGLKGGDDTRHPEFISVPPEANTDDRGKRDEVLSRQSIEDKPVQDDDSPNTVRPEPVEGPLSTGNCPSTSSGRTETGDNPTPNTRHDGWHLDLRVKFLEALAQTGNVQASAYFVQRTRQSAYDLKRRDPDFARAWLAALVLAREEAQDKLQERAIEGIEEEIFYHGEVVATRRRYDSRLLLAHLARLDKIAEQIPAQRGAARFGDMLTAIGAGEDTAPLIATPTEEELAVLAAAAERWRQPEQPPEEEADEFYAVTFPDHDGPPDYYRMTPEEAAEMERDVPGLTARATGTADDAVINALVFHAQAVAECPADWEEKGKNL